MPSELSIANLDSGFAITFLKLQKYILAQVPEIVIVDQELGQLEVGDQRPPGSFPMLLIDFGYSAYSNLSEKVQWLDFNINTRLAFAPYSSASSLVPDVTKLEALQYFEIENKLYKALAGWTADDTIQPLIRISAVTERREDTLRVREIIYTSAAEDEGAKRPVVMTPGMLRIATEIMRNNE